jgi:hypothetical protein
MSNSERITAKSNIDELILDWEFNDIRDKTDGFIENLFNRYVIQTNQEGICRCNETKKDQKVRSYYQSKSQLKNLLDIICISLKSTADGKFIIHQIPIQAPLKNQHTKESFNGKLNEKYITIELLCPTR